MIRMRIVWSPEALHDLVMIRDYIAEFHPVAAKAIAARIVETTDKLKTHPQSGQIFLRDNVRRLVIRNSAYSVFYKLSSTEIIILQVFNGRQETPRFLKDV